MNDDRGVWAERSHRKNGKIHRWRVDGLGHLFALCGVDGRPDTLKARLEASSAIRPFLCQRCCGKIALEQHEDREKSRGDGPNLWPVIIIGGCARGEEFHWCSERPDQTQCVRRDACDCVYDFSHLNEIGAAVFKRRLFAPHK